jgi:hypothetical protein
VPSVVPGVSPLTLEAIAETNSGLPEIMAKHE